MTAARWSRAPFGATLSSMASSTQTHADHVLDGLELDDEIELDGPELDDEALAAIEAVEAARVPETEEEIEAHVEEIVKRIHEVQAGTAVLLTTDEVLQSLRAEFGL